MTATRPASKTVALVLNRDASRCAVCGEEVYGVRGEDWSVHHRRRAGMGGDRRPESHAAGNLVLLHGSGTTACHGKVESEREDSYARGWLVKANAMPALQPIEHAVHGRVFLNDEGGWSACAEQ